MTEKLAFIRRRNLNLETQKKTESATLSIKPVKEKKTSRVLPRTENVKILTSEKPMVVLTRLQSGTGSLKITFKGVGGIADALWEMQNGKQGTFNAIPYDDGKRPLFSKINDETTVIGLRHVRNLRRLLFYTYPNVSVEIETYDNEIIKFEQNTRLITLYQHDGEIYIRHETKQYSSQKDLFESNGF